jgi:hypothetical protein
VFQSERKKIVFIFCNKGEVLQEILSEEGQKNPQMYNILFCFSGSADHGDTYDIGVTGINTYIHTCIL